MPRVSVKQRGRHELPRVRIFNPVFTESQIVVHKTGLECVQKQLGDETGDIERDQSQQNDTSAFLPWPREY
jgi:hypothetical protein